LESKSNKFTSTGDPLPAGEQLLTPKGIPFPAVQQQEKQEDKERGKEDGKIIRVTEKNAPVKEKSSREKKTSSREKKTFTREKNFISCEKKKFTRVKETFTRENVSLSSDLGGNYTAFFRKSPLMRQGLLIPNSGC
jgi:hypothetical protein